MKMGKRTARSNKLCGYNSYSETSKPVYFIWARWVPWAVEHEKKTQPPLKSKFVFIAQRRRDGNHFVNIWPWPLAGHHQRSNHERSHQLQTTPGFVSGMNFVQDFTITCSWLGWMNPVHPNSQEITTIRLGSLNRSHFRVILQVIAPKLCTQSPFTKINFVQLSST